MGLFVISLLGILIALLMNFLPEEHRYQKPESLLLFFHCTIINGSGCGNTQWKHVMGY